ncbi:hypothetical protein BOX15_Mlig019094g1, partial [Macrostomum lignano]
QTSAMDSKQSDQPHTAAPSATPQSRLQQAAAEAVARSRLRRQLIEFTKETSLPGVSQAGLSSGRGLVWTGLLSLSLVALIVHLCIIVTVYLRYSTTTSSSYDQPFQWPDVTLCNLVPLSVSAVNEHLAEAPTSPSNSLGRFFDALPALAESISAANGPDVTNSQSLRELMTRSRNLTPVEHKLANSLLSCNYRGVQCPTDSIKQTYVPRFHTCFTVSIGSAGGSSGTLADDDFLDMMLFVESGVLSYWDRRTLADFSPAGKVFVHARGSYPDVEDILDLPTGAWVMLGLRYTERHNFEGRCAKYQGEVKFSTPSGEKLFTSPSDRRSCLESSIQAELIRQCGCISEKFRRFDAHPGQPGCHSVGNASSGSASTEDRARAACHGRVLPQALEAAGTECRIDCLERDWAIRVSPHVWPKLDASVTALFDAYAEPAVRLRGFDPRLLLVNGTTNVTTLDAKSQLEFVQRSFLRITVNPTSTIGLRIDESLVYTAGNLLSDLGGILGLYLGFSIVFIYEIAFLLVKLVRDSRAGGGGAVGTADSKSSC